MTLLLDTTVLIDALRHRLDRHLYLAELSRAQHVLSTTAVNLGELFAGLRPNDEARAATLLNDIEFFAITPELGRRGGELKSAWARRGRTLSLDDALIAAVALEHSLPLLTDNRRDFPMSELRLWPLPQAQ